MPLPVNRQERNISLEFLQAIHAMYVAILAARKIRDEQAPMLFPSARHARQTGYPYQQLIGPVPRTENLGTLTLAKPTSKTWPWELPFLADLLSWTRQLVWADEPRTVTFIELALDFEEMSQRTLPTAPQAKYRGTALPLQERARVLRLALCTMQKLVTRGALHPAKVITRANSLVPLGGPQQSGLSKRPYFVSRQAMVGHIAKLSQYCEETWALRAQSRQNKARAYVYRHRHSPAEVEEARTQRALMGALNTGLMPSSPDTAKGGGGGLRRKFLPRHWAGQKPAGAISDNQATQVRSAAGAASMCDSTGTTYMRTGSRPVQYTPARTVHHMQTSAQVRGRVLCPRTSPARICGQAAPVSHVPPAWTAGLRQMHQNAMRGPKLLCQRAPQSTHAGARAASRAGHATS